MTCLLPQAVTCPAFMSFGFSEILLVGIVALLVFGGNLPDVMRSLGRSYGKLRASLHEFSRPVRDELREVQRMPPRTETPPESRPQEDPPEYPDYGEPPITPAADSEDAGTTARPEVSSGGAADEPPPV